ncbi:MAG TPA: COR domain-containing protein [Pyrinomonadaceae bacterium]|nr:COR domain-containing protein [Pyrinomonadaceae bacterium]
MTQLEALFLDNNQLTALPESIGQLTQLEALFLNDNELAALPQSIGRLTRLYRLDLTNNRLTTLPESVGDLTALQTLFLNGNRLRKLPESLRNLSRLKGLFLQRNKSLGLPAEVLGQEPGTGITGPAPVKPAEILEYYFRVRGGERRPLNEAKLILVGRGAVGKTSIANRLIHGTFEDAKKTEGIKITEWPLTVGENRDDVRLNVWDFGGQEIMHATHQFFLTERSLYLLVLSGREGVEDADAEYWLKLIQSFGGGSPVVLVLNKIKEYQFDVNRNALLRKYPFIRDFIKTDCEDATGIEELRRVVERETDRLEHLRDAFPRSWFSIKDKLAGMEKNYLSFDEYRNECAKLGEEDPQAQESLAFYLHSLGIALNYKDDPRLKDTHVLNPHWVTSGIYKILNANLLEKKKGEISLKDLPSILDAKEYPKKMHGFLLNLMEKFELCFGLEGREGVYLIPELLDKQQPDEADEFDPAECLNFQYHYPVLPEGLLPRFVVRTHILGDEKSLWRTGVILEFEGSRALVKADVQDKRVFVNVKGPAESRRRLLGLIRSDFEQIHRGIRNLNPLEMVPLPEQPGVLVSYEELAVMERQGVESFPKVVDGLVTQLDVRRLLNGVDIEGVRRADAAVNELRPAARVFVSYTRRDERLRKRLEVNLKLLKRAGLIETWQDRDIEAGEEWREKIDENLERADIILLLVSDDFLASDYCYEIEMRRALELHEGKKARVIPIIARPVNWELTRLPKLNALPQDGRAITVWPNRDNAWKNVSEGIQKVAETVRKKKARAG